MGGVGAAVAAEIAAAAGEGLRRRQEVAVVGFALFGGAEDGVGFADGNETL